tara:strand:- start:107 stop:1327 length:1221 start_codon:yes stop_codon:yes gene_type:complete
MATPTGGRFSFKHLRVVPVGADDPEADSLLAKVGGFVHNKMAYSRFHDEFDFGRAGGCPVVVRASIVCLAFMKLAATGMLAALVALSTSSSEAAFSCALAAAVNLVACFHYAWIWRIRAQHVPPAYAAWAHRKGAAQATTDVTEAGKTKDREVNEDDRDFAQEVMVDSFRCAAQSYKLTPKTHADFAFPFRPRRNTDWTVSYARTRVPPHQQGFTPPSSPCFQATLPLMTLDLFDLASHATRGVVPIMSKYLCASLMPVMIGCGALYRFWLNEGRPSEKGRRHCGCGLLLAFLSFLAALAIFVPVLYALNDPLYTNTCLNAATSVEESCGTLTDSEQRDKTAVYALSFAWLGYPLVSIAARLAQYNAVGAEFSPNVSVFKDVAYACLDVTSKGGLAIYVAYRSSWL